MVTVDDATLVALIAVAIVVVGAIIGYLLKTERRLTKLEVKVQFLETFEKGVATGKTGRIVALEEEREVTLIREKAEKK
ncbi:MAG TPA: hypothetical protein VGS11_07610 [Candidatus Bathyarchaeia archaeon]|nr:hypothetical protein [Candidatus Bathyarchaeia archaeon]